MQEDQYWRQKAWVKWYQEGNQNIKFFHAVIKERRVQNQIHGIRNLDGV